MKKVKNILIGLLVFSIIALCFIFNGPLVTEASSDDENSRPYTQLKNTTSDPETIYSDKYQKNIYQQIKKIKQINNYTFNTTGIYMYFTTDYQCVATYTISCEGYEDFTRTLNTNSLSGFSKEHEYLLIGSIPDAKNTITVTLTDTNGKQVDSITWSYQAPKLSGGDQYLSVATESYDTTSALSNGLYTVLGNDVTEENDEQTYMRLYDNDGVIRSEIPIISYRSHRILFEDNTMYLSVSSTKIVGVDQTGYVSTIYSTGDYKLHHDYILDAYQLT